MAKNKKTPRPKARLPKGMRDIPAEEIRAQDAMLRIIRDVYESYGFEPLDTPAFEYTENLGKFLPDQDRPNEGVFSFQDEDEQWLSLRYDLTAPLARHVAENFDQLPKPFRRYQAGPVWRNEKPGPGRFRQFMQFDADTVGAASVAADAEMCMLAADALEALGIMRGDYVIKVNNRKVLDGVLESIDVGDEGQKLTVLRAIDKLDRLGVEGVELLLGKGRKDESGDVTQGAGLNKRQIEKILVFAQLQSGKVTELEDVTNLTPAERAERGESLNFGNEGGEETDVFVESNQGVINGLMTHFGSNPMSGAGVQELQQISDLVEAAGYKRDRIRIDPSVVRGLEYYTGPVFEAELTFEAKDEKGNPVRFGSVGGGGRYDGLVARFKGQEVPATGFSIGVSRLYAALQTLGKLPGSKTLGPVVVTVFDKERMADYQRMVQELRNAKIRAELYLGNPKNMGAQFKYADQRGSPCVVIQGGDEKERGEVQIKDLIEGARAAENIATNEEWRAERPAQFAVPEDKLIEAVREVLARHES